MSTAAKVRAEKDQHPERFCRVKKCLWRIVTHHGPNPCRRHPVAIPAEIAIAHVLDEGVSQ